MKLSEQTPIAIGSAIAVAVAAIAFTAWITTIANQGVANANSVQKLEVQNEKVLEKLDEIKEDVAIIKARLEKVK